MNIKKERLSNAYEYALATYQGRQFVWEVLSMTNTFSTLSDDIHEMLRQEGRRRLGLILMSELEERHPEKYHLMLKEGKQRIKEEIANDYGDDSNNRENGRSEDSRGSGDDYGDGGSASLPAFDGRSIPGI